MNQLLNSPFAEDIGMTLVHSLWQIAMVAVVFAIANRFLSRRSANLRYVVAYAALLLMLALPGLTLCAISGQLSSSPEPLTVAMPPLEEIPVVGAARQPGFTSSAGEVDWVSTEAAGTWTIDMPYDADASDLAEGPQAAQSLNWILPWLSVGWSLGVMAFSLRPLLGLHRCHQLRAQAIPLRESWIKRAVESLCSRIELNRKVEIACSSLVHVPTVVGVMRPVILLPLCMVSGQTPHELSAIIAHELAHIRRHDFLLNLFQTAIETLLFYHPAAWWVSTVVRQERENCCDDIAMSICGRKNYATALANLEFARTRETSLAVAADGGSLYRRIRRLVRPHENPNPLGRWLAAVIASATLLIGIVAMLPTDSVAVGADAESKAEAAKPEKPLSLRNGTFVIARTDKEGNFTATRVIPNALLDFYEMSSPKGARISNSTKLKPGEVRDFGVVQLDAEVPKRARLNGFNVIEASAETPTTARESVDNPATLTAAAIADEPPPTRNPDPVAARSPPDGASEGSDERSYAGQVLLPNGRPAAGADVYLVHWAPTPLKKAPVKPLDKTDNEGRFRFTLKRDQHGDAASGTIVAKLDGYAFAWAVAPALEESADSKRRFADAPPQFRDLLERDRGPMRLLPDDTEVTGRVVDSEGNGIFGVTVYVSEVLAGPDNTMAAWDRVLNGSGPDYMKLQNALVRTLRGPYVPTLFGETKTNDEGRFTIRGLGNHRIVKLVLQGSGIVADSVYARTSGGKSVVLPMEATQQGPGLRFTYHGTSFTLVAERSRPVVGRVTDEEGRGIPGVIINSTRSFSNRLEDDGTITWTQSGSDDVMAISDSEGRYRLTGLPIADSNMIRVWSPADSSYLPVGAWANTAESKEPSSQPRYAPVTKDFTLRQGLIVEGRVTDSQSGAGVAGHFQFAREESDGKYSTTPRGAAAHVMRSDADGTFRIVIPRAVGVLTFNAFERQKYKVSDSSTAESPLHVEVVEGNLRMFGASLAQGHAVHSIQGDEFDEGETRLRLDLKVQPASVTTGHAVGPDGERLTDVFYTGHTAPVSNWNRSADGELKLFDFRVKQPRRVMVVQTSKRLAGMRTLSSADNGFEVKLQPWATVRGRIVDFEGDPLAGVRIHSGTGKIETFTSPAEAMKSQAKRKHPLILPPRDALGNFRFATDQDGRFEIAGLIPGEPYHLNGQYSMMGPINVLINTFARDLMLRPGEVRDLGDVVLKKAEPRLQPMPGGSAVSVARPIGVAVPVGAVQRSPGPTEEAPVKARRHTPTSLSYSGRVTNPDGSPAMGAHVAVIATELDGQVWRDAHALAETTADADGRFQIHLDPVSEKTHTNAHLVMRTDESGIAWRQLDLKQRKRSASKGVTALGELKLEPAEPIQCRLVDLEGRPAANLEAEIDAIIVPAKEGTDSEWLRFFRLKQPPKAWVQRLRTNEHGLLTIPNITSGQGVYLRVLPTDAFAPQHIALNTGMAEERGERDGTYRSIVKNMRRGEVATIPLSPAKLFMGVVRFADTGQPAANSKIEIWARQENSGSMMSIFDKTDDEGRFRLNPYPGVHFGITAHPPDGTAYQIKRLGGYEGLRWSSGDETRNITIELDRGVSATGRIVDAKSGEPIVNAAVQYQPMRTNPNNSDDIITGWQGIKKTDERGEFRISVLPGEGWLLVHTNSRDYVLQERTGRQLAFGKPGGLRHYAHAFLKINPKDGGVNVGQVRLTPARSVTLEVVDPDGQPIAEGVAVSRLHVVAHAGWWRGQNPDVVKDGRVEIGGLDEGVEYPIYLLDAKRELGAVAKVNANQTTKRVTLQPCGSATVRLTREGEPAAGKTFALQLVVTPGVHRFDVDAMRNEGAVAADEDFVSNIDRLNHWNNFSDEDGRLVLAALIPGATYRYPAGDQSTKEFVAESGETFNLGEQALADSE